MSDNLCSSCAELKKTAPNFMLNGIGEEECQSLMKNTGLNPNLPVLKDNCEDMHDVVDCLIGQFGDELVAYDLCDLKDYLAKLMANLYNVHKMFVCDSCGLWDAINNVNNQINIQREAIQKILNNLHSAGAITNNNIQTYQFVAGRRIANGNINVFGGAMDGSSFIRTSNSAQENDIGAGY